MPSSKNQGTGFLPFAPFYRILIRCSAIEDAQSAADALNMALNVRAIRWSEMLVFETRLATSYTGSKLMHAKILEIYRVANTQVQIYDKQPGI